MPRVASELAPLTYTIPQAARVLNLSDKTVKDLISRKELPVMRIGRRVLISRKELEEWVATNGRSTFAGPRGKKAS